MGGLIPIALSLAGGWWLYRDATQPGGTAFGRVVAKNFNLTLWVVGTVIVGLIYAAWP